MKTGFLQSIAGNQSSTRLIGFSVVYSAIIILFAMVVFCFIHPELATEVLTAVGILFTALTTPTFIFLYKQKSTELKQESHE
jgi:hypothetical protein